MSKYLTAYVKKTKANLLHRIIPTDQEDSNHLLNQCGKI